MSNSSVPGASSSMTGSVFAAKHSIYAYSKVLLADPLPHRLGDKLELGDGRIFRYAVNGAVELAPAKAVQGPVPSVGHQAMVCPTASATNDKHVWVTLDSYAATANQYAEGMLHVDSTTTIFGVKIKGHLAQTSSTGNLKINLYDPIPVATTVSSTITLTKNLYDGVVVAPNANLTAAIAGVPLITIPATDATYKYGFWCQVGGPCPLYNYGTIVIGQPVGLGGTTDGACGPIAADTTDIWGVTMRLLAATNTSLVWLKIGI